MAVTGTTGVTGAPSSQPQSTQQGTGFQIPPAAPTGGGAGTPPGPLVGGSSGQGGGVQGGSAQQGTTGQQGASGSQTAQDSGGFHAGVNGSVTASNNVTEVSTKRVFAGRENDGGAVKDKAGVTPLETKQIAHTHATRLGVSAGYKPTPDAGGGQTPAGPQGPLDTAVDTAARWGNQAMTALGVKDVSVAAEVTVGRQDSGVQSWNSTKPGEISRYDERIPVAVRAGVSVQIDNALFSGSIGADLSAKVMTKTDAATGRDRSGFEVAGTVKGSHSQTGTLQSQNHATGQPGSQSPDPSGVQNSSTVTVGAVGEQVKITTLEALDPKAYDEVTGAVDVDRAVAGGLAAGTKLAAHVVTQAPGALVQGALNTGQMMFDGTNFAAKALVDGATYLASNAVHSVRNGFAGGHEAGVQAMQDGQARRQAYEAGNTDAGEMLGRASAQVGTFNSGVGAVVDAVVGAPVDLARLHYTGDAALGMDNQQLRQAGYGSLAATQEKVEAASAGLQANPMFQAPSLPSSPAEALRRITPG